MNIRYPIYEGVYRILTFQFGGRNVVLKNIAVGLENNRLVPYAGNIGMALINQFDKVTINFDKCFVIFE